MLINDLAPDAKHVYIKRTKGKKGVQKVMHIFFFDQNINAPLRQVKNHISLLYLKNSIFYSAGRNMLRRDGLLI